MRLKVLLSDYPILEISLLLKVNNTIRTLECCRVALSAIKARHNFKNIVFSDIRKANPFFGICLYCISVRNKIYVLKIEMVGPVVLASYVVSLIML